MNAQDEGNSSKAVINSAMCAQGMCGMGPSKNGSLECSIFW